MTIVQRCLAVFLASLLCLFATTALAAPALDPDAVYVVKRGDTLYELSSRYLVGRDAPAVVGRLNRIADPRRMPVGKRLTIPFRLLRTEPVAGEITAFSGAVRIDVGSGPRPATRGMQLTQGAVLETDGNAFVTVGLPDASRITIPSQSRVRIVRLRRILLTDSLDRVFAVERGRSESTVSPLPNPDSRYLINTPVASAAVRGTVFRVSFDPDSGRAASEVIEGAVGVSPAAAGSEVLAGPSTGVRADAGGVSQPIRLLAAPQVDRAGRDQTGEAVEFAVLPQPDAARWRLQIANDAGFVDIFRETLTEDGRAAFPDIADGTYFLRATALDEAGLEGMPAVWGFYRELSTVSMGEPVVSREGPMRRYLFRWQTGGAGVKTFRFQLYRSGETDRALFDEPGLTESAITLTDLPSGEYQWRVIVSTFNRGRMTQTTSETQTLRIGG